MLYIWSYVVYGFNIVIYGSYKVIYGHIWSIVYIRFIWFVYNIYIYIYIYMYCSFTVFILFVYCFTIWFIYSHIWPYMALVWFTYGSYMVTNGPYMVHRKLRREIVPDPMPKSFRRGILRGDQALPA
jgi:hypothetical protein